MTLETTLRSENAADRMWAVLIEHSATSQLELHTWERNAVRVHAREQVEVVDDFLISTEPFTCAEGLEAGLDLLLTCARCQEPTA
jgi:hypothetical protein